MVRRVGFSKYEEEPETREPSAIPEAHEAKAVPQNDIANIGLGSRIFQIGFLLFWLTGWTGGIIAAFFFLPNAGGFSTVFLIFWLVFASIFWVMALKRLFALVRGK